MSLKNILAIVGLCLVAPGIYYKITAGDSYTARPENQGLSDKISKLPIMNSELSRVVVIYIEGVRSGPKSLTLREWLAGLYKNPEVEEINAERVWIGSIWPYLVIHVKTNTENVVITNGFAFGRHDNELILQLFQVQPNDGYYKVSEMPLLNQLVLAQTLMGRPK